MQPQSPVLFGQMLVDRRIITAEQLSFALEEQKKAGQPLGITLVRMGFVSSEQAFLPVLAERNNVGFVVLKNTLVAPDVLARVPPKVANHYKVFPVRYDARTLYVALCHGSAWDIAVLDDLAMLTRCRIVPLLAAEKDILDAIHESYGVGAETIEKMMTDNTSVSGARDLIEEIDEQGAEASISLFLNQVMYAAYKEHATDIHIEPFEEQLRIRYRIDGVLYDAKAPVNIRFFKDILVSRIKILANLNIAEKRLPQDGRFRVNVNDQRLDLRVSFLPTAFGESAVIRILNSARLYSFDELGFTGTERESLDALLRKEHGTIFLTGPTGSGKTTTLYSCLVELNKDDTKIITVEDPVEYQLGGIVQVQAHADIGLNFATVLRSMLRNDPDVLMVGEVRDRETAQIAVQAALTGHLVLSTLHTNDAASGIARLMDMGVEPYLIASAVECFIAQRLVRVVCVHCRKRVVVTPVMARDFGFEYDTIQAAAVYESAGCPACRMTGFQGRQAIGEFLFLDEKIRSMIVRRSSAGEIKDSAIRGGMKTLRMNGWEKIIAGLTTPSEVIRVTHED
jgi:type II secretory ATPase GspE/PulE/Tfp pilus assembly ATPase PilB-like protein